MHANVVNVLEAGLGDFISKTTAVNLSRSRQRKCMRISIRPDIENEEYESFTVELSRISLPSDVVLSPNIATVTIYDF